MEDIIDFENIDMEDIYEQTSDELYSDLYSFAFKIEEPKSGSYYRVRQTNPSKYKEFRIIDIDKKKGVKAVLGIFEEDKKKKSEVQSYLFDKESWKDKKGIKEWLNKNVAKKSKKSNASVYESVSNDIDIEIVNEPGGNTSFIDRVVASQKLTRNKDLMYFAAKYVHEGSNLNQDFFEYDELKEKYATPILKPVNWEHDESKIIGTIYDSEFVDRKPSNGSNGGDDEGAYIKIYGVIYKKLFPEVASYLSENYKNDKTLHVSMETWFEKAKCNICGGTFASSEDYCDHLNNRFVEPNNKRILKNITFGGVGIVQAPADIKAEVLAMASKNAPLKEKVNKSLEFTKVTTILDAARETFYDIMYSYYENKDTEVKDKKQKLSDLIKEMTDLMNNINLNKLAKGDNQVDDKVKYPEEIVNALIEKAKADKSDEFKNQLNSELEKVNADWETKVSDLNKELNKVKEDKEKVEKEFATFKDTIEKEKVLAARKKVLADNHITFEGKEEKDVDAIIMSMEDNTFDLFVSAKKVDEDPKDDVSDGNGSDKAKASVKIADNDGDPKDGDDDEPNIRDIIGKI